MNAGPVRSSSSESGPRLAELALATLGGLWLARRLGLGNVLRLTGAFCLAKRLLTPSAPPAAAPAVPAAAAAPTAPAASPPPQPTPRAAPIVPPIPGFLLAPHQEPCAPLQPFIAAAEPPPGEVPELPEVQGS